MSSLENQLAASRLERGLKVFSLVLYANRSGWLQLRGERDAMLMMIAIPIIVFVLVPLKSNSI